MIKKQDNRATVFLSIDEDTILFWIWALAATPGTHAVRLTWTTKNGRSASEAFQVDQLPLRLDELPDVDYDTVTLSITGRYAFQVPMSSEVDTILRLPRDNPAGPEFFPVDFPVWPTDVTPEIYILRRGAGFGGLPCRLVTIYGHNDGTSLLGDIYVTDIWWRPPIQFNEYLKLWPALRWPKNLKPLQKAVLKVMLAQKATSECDLVDADYILEVAGIKKEKATDYKQQLASLPKMGLARSKGGKRGGYWLTAEGIATATTLTKR